MATPVQMFDHALDPLKGWFRPSAVDIQGTLDSAVTADPIYSGRCVHVHSIGTDTKKTPIFRPGAVGSQVPVFLFSGNERLSVSNAGGSVWYPIAPAGVMAGLVGTDGLELATTEFDTTQTYLINQYVRAVRSDSSSSTAGTLTNQTITLYTTSVHGVTSRGKYTNHNGKTVLGFWTVYLPGSESNT